MQDIMRLLLVAYVLHTRLSHSHTLYTVCWSRHCRNYLGARQLLLPAISLLRCLHLCGYMCDMMTCKHACTHCVCITYNIA